MNLIPQQQFFTQNQMQPMQFHTSFNPGSPMMAPQQTVPINPIQTMQPLSMIPPMCTPNPASMNTIALNSLQSQQLPAAPPNQTLRPAAQSAPQNPKYSAMQPRPSEQPAAVSFSNSNSFTGPQQLQQLSGLPDSMALPQLPLPPASMLEHASLAGPMGELDGDLDGHHGENVCSCYGF